MKAPDIMRRGDYGVDESLARSHSIASTVCAAPRERARRLQRWPGVTGMDITPP